jgi:hypothetical protein
MNSIERFVGGILPLLESAAAIRMTQCAYLPGFAEYSFCRRPPETAWETALPERTKLSLLLINMHR